jgi:hypothetical protein
MFCLDLHESKQMKVISLCITIALEHRIIYNTILQLTSETDIKIHKASEFYET